MLLLMRRDLPESRPPKHRLIVRREYLRYYLVTLAYGCQKRIRLVFAPWVIVELMREGADVLALLTIATHFAGTLVSPRLGKLLDRKGLRFMLLFEAGYIVVTFCGMGFLAGRMAQGTTVYRYVMFAAFVLVNLFEQFNMVHAFLMRRLAVDPSEVTESLSFGLSVDHVMAVVASALLGLAWTALGVQVVFYLAAASAVIQVLVGLRCREL
jgi:hypothetical protein